jgi:PRA1 family protein
MRDDGESFESEANAPSTSASSLSSSSSAASASASSLSLPLSSSSPTSSPSQPPLVLKVTAAWAFLKETLTDNLRPWGDFVAVIKPPKEFKYNVMEQRVSTNLVHYQKNYTLICFGILGFRCLFIPNLLAACILTAAVVFFFFFIQRGKLVTIWRNSIVIQGDKGKRVISLILALVIFSLFYALESLFWSVLFAVIVCASHMVLRPRSVSSKPHSYENLRI